MAERLFAEVVVKGKNFDLTVGVKNRPKVTFLAVDSCGTGGFIKTRTEALCDFKNGCSVFIFTDNAAFECYVG